MATDDHVNLDEIIEQLVNHRKSPKQDKVELKENDVKLIVSKVREIFLNQPILLELGKYLSRFLDFSFRMLVVDIRRGAIENLRRYTWSIRGFTSFV